VALQTHGARVLKQLHCCVCVCVCVRAVF
jgi:hypothetical protein